jgi:hypothetical protein
MSVHTRLRLWLAVASPLLGVLASGIPASQAQASAGGVGACDQASLSQPFMRWSDFNHYKLAPGGDFEGLSTSWARSGGAAVVAGSEPWGVGGSLGSRSLALPPGARGQSPATCVNAAYPTLRFFARAQTPGSLLLVSVLYPTILGQVELAVGLVAPTSAWGPAPPMSTVTAILGLVQGATAPIVVRFTAVLGTSQIDDVYIDPHGLG